MKSLLARVSETLRRVAADSECAFSTECDSLADEVDAAILTLSGCSFVLLAKRPERRPSIAERVEALNLAAFRKNGRTFTTEHVAEAIGLKAFDASDRGPRLGAAETVQIEAALKRLGFESFRPPYARRASHWRVRS